MDQRVHSKDTNTTKASVNPSTPGQKTPAFGLNPPPPPALGPLPRSIDPCLFADIARGGGGGGGGVERIRRLEEVCAVLGSG